MSSVTATSSAPLTPAQAQAVKDLAKRGAMVDAMMIAGEAFVAAAGGYAAITNTNPFTGGEISSAWDGMARVSVAAGSALAAGDAARRSGRLVQNLQVLSQ